MSAPRGELPRYVVEVQPEAQRLRVELTLPAAGTAAEADGGERRGRDNEPRDELLRLTTPTWVAGAYAFLRYGRDLHSLEVTDADSGEALPFERDGWAGFRIDAAGCERVRVRYLASASDPTVAELAGLVTGGWAVVPGTRLLFCPERPGPCEVRYELPGGWALHHPGGAEQLTGSTWRYARFEDVVDTPVVAGAFRRIERRLEGVTFHHVFIDDALGFEPLHRELLDQVMETAVAARDAFGPFPFEAYTFVYSFDPRFEWGLEHANATLVGVGPDALIDGTERQRAVRVCAHELVHAWNVCRLRPSPLGTLDLERGSFTDGLWVSEGLTRYYEFLLLARTGMISPAQLFSNVARAHQQLAARPAYRRVDPRDSSRATFVNHCRYAGAVNASIDYYDAGMLVCFDLDAKLREDAGAGTGPDADAAPAVSPPHGADPADARHGSGQGLDRAFRALYAAKAGDARGFTHAEALEHLGATPAARELLARETERPGALSTLERLEALGFELEQRAVQRLGLVLDAPATGSIADVMDEGAAARAGLSPGDVIESIDGLSYSVAGLRWRVANADGVSVRLGVRRGHQHLERSVSPEAAQELVSLIWKGSEADRARLADWLGVEPDWGQGERIPLDFHENFHGTPLIV